MVLGNKDWLLSCACSAGPAFEGGGVRYGMPGADGAIERAAAGHLQEAALGLLRVGEGAPLMTDISQDLQVIVTAAGQLAQGAADPDAGAACIILEQFLRSLP